MRGFGGDSSCSAPQYGRGSGGRGGIHTHTHTHTHTHIYIYTHTHIHTQRGTHTHREKHTHTHTEERTRECCTYPLATYPVKKCRNSKSCFAKPPGLLQESLGPFGPEVSRECPSGCLWCPSGPGLRSVQKVSRECPRSVRDTFLTLRGRSRDTFWTLRSPGSEGPQKHPEEHSRDTSGPKGPRDSCSTPGGSQILLSTLEVR